MQVDRGWTFSIEGKSLRQKLSFISDDTLIEGQLRGLSEDQMPEIVHKNILSVGVPKSGKTMALKNIFDLEMDQNSSEKLFNGIWPIREMTGHFKIFYYNIWELAIDEPKSTSHDNPTRSVQPTSTAPIQNQHTLPEVCDVVMLNFSILEKESFEFVKNFVANPAHFSLEKTKDSVWVIVATNTDQWERSKVSKDEISEFSIKHNLPVYLLKNLPEHKHPNFVQHEMNTAKFKNDIADFLFAGKEWKSVVRPYTLQSRFIVSTRNISSKKQQLRSELRLRQEQPHRTSGLFSLFGSFSSQRDKESNSNSNSNNNSNNNSISNSQSEKETGSLGNSKFVTVDQNHSEYPLVYCVTIGLRKAVVEAAAKRANREEETALYYAMPKVVLLPGDFTKLISYTCNKQGIADEDDTNLAPEVHPYSFRFKDYAPFVFRNIRAQAGINDSNYLISLTENIRLIALGSPGKSGACFFWSEDFRFVIKSLTETEAELFRRILMPYYQHLISNPNTLLVKFLGLHVVQMIEPSAQEMHFVVMENAFPSKFEIHERYDLKGSTQGRNASVDEKQNTSAILKDLDIKRKFKVGEETMKTMTHQLTQDAKFLEAHNIMDYSLLVGVHKMSSDKEYGKSLTQNEESVALPDITVSAFRKDFEGLMSIAQDEIYFFTIIDILQEWNVKKKVENSFKSLMYEKASLSAVSPDLYCERFIKFLAALLE